MLLSGFISSLDKATNCNSELAQNIVMKSKVTFDDLKKIKTDFTNYLLNIALKPTNAAFEAVNGTFEVSKENFLKVVASDYNIVYFIGKAWLAAREEEKSDLSVHSFYLFDDLLSK